MYGRHIISILLLTIVCCFLTTSVSADDKYAVKIDFDSKLIYVDSLSLPKSFKAIGILQILPEILERPGDVLASDYDIKINDMSVGDARDVVLSQIRLAQIEKIEVSESPLSTYNNNGQGGSINIFLRKKPADEDKKVWGSASVDYEYETDVTPFAQINYNDKKFSLIGLLMGEYYNSTIPNYTYSENETSKNTRKQDFRNQMARVYLNYCPTAKDNLTLGLSEVLSRTKYDCCTTLDGLYSSGYLDKENKTTLRALFNYKHTFGSRSKIEIETQYLYEPGENSNDDFIAKFDKEDDHSNSLSGKVEYTLGLLPVSNPDKINLVLGFSNNNSWKKNDYTFVFSDGYKSQSQLLNPGTYAYTIGDNSFHIMPYVNLEMTLGQFRIKAVGEYQFYRNDMSISKSIVYNKAMPDSRRDRSDFTGKLMFCWQLARHQHLRLILDRKLQRPSLSQIYQYYYYNPDADKCFKGNSSLTPMLSHEISLDYISDYSWDDRKFVLNAGVSYNHVSDVITSSSLDNVIVTKDGKDYQLECLTFVNSGKVRIYNADLMMMYSYKCFSLSFTGNVFHNDQILESGEGKPHYTYYNMSLLPSLNLKNGWMASLDMLYYSKVTTTDYTLGDCLTAQLNIGKNFGRWNVHVLGRWTVTGKTKNEYDSMVTENWLQRNAVGAGFMYRF